MARVLIVGASSMVGSHLAVALRASHRVWGTYSRHRPELDQVTLLSLPLHPGSPVREVVRAIRPRITIYCAGIADERQCAQNQVQAHFVNAEGAAIIAEEMAAIHGSLVFLSSSKVFSGERGAYREEDTADGATLYGRMKRQAEERLAAHRNVLILRLGNVFGLSQVPQRTFLNRLLKDLHNRQGLPLITDEFRTYYGVDEVCRAISHLLTVTPFPSGLYHLGDGGRDSYHSFSLKVAGIFGLDASLLKPIHGAEFTQSQGAAGNRGGDLSLVGEVFAQQFGFRLAPPEESLTRLKERLRTGRL